MNYFLSRSHALCFVLLVSLFGDIVLADSDNQSMLVLDASGSMWGQIDGKTKIEIAREVVSSTAQSWHPEQSLGLIAYGHNRESDCSDIEVLIEPSTVDVAQFSATANSLSPKGKTPLSAAVKMAAEQLRYTEQKATVILISDGKENCDLDPCAVGKALESSGIDFTAHIIGFDVPKEDSLGLRCLAQETGGAYLEAKDAGELEKALEQTREVVTDSEQVKLSTASVSVPQEVFAGSVFDVVWEGPNNVSDTLIARSQDNAYSSSATYIGVDNQSSPTSMIAPNEPGTYLVHYELKDKTSLASAKLTVVTPQASVEVAESIVAGTRFSVIWNGPNNEFDSLRLFNMDGEYSQEFAMLSSDDFKSPVQLTAPVDVGEYEIRYVTLAKTVLAKDVFSVTEALATVYTPREASAGAPIEVTWTGPQNRSDRLNMYDNSGKKLNNYQFVDKENTPPVVIMTVPDEPGQYSLVYLAENKKNIAQANFNVLPVTAMVSGPAVVNADTEFEVSWFGPKYAKDSIYIFSKDGKDMRSYQFIGKESSVSPIILQSPKLAGDYEIRYLTKNRTILATHDFSVR